jgi:hypothetical protein
VAASSPLSTSRRPTSGTPARDLIRCWERGPVVRTTPPLAQYLRDVKRRLGLGLTTRGLGLEIAAAVVLTVACVLLARPFGFVPWSVIAARALLFLGLAVVAAVVLVRPLAELRGHRWVRHVAARDPALAERLHTVLDRTRDADAPMRALLADETFERTGSVPPARVMPARVMLAWGTAALASLLALGWLGWRAPGALGHGTALLWAGWLQPAPAARQIAVEPGSVTVRRRADVLVRALPQGFYAEGAALSVQHEGSREWEPVPMLPRPDERGFEFVLAGVDTGLRYRVIAGGTTSTEYEVRVEEMPRIRSVKLVYHYPQWTGRPPHTAEPGGDVRAVAGTTVDVYVTTDRPLTSGVLRLNDAQSLDLQAAGANSRGQLTVTQDARYFIAALYGGEVVRLSDDYLIEVVSDRPPLAKVARPGRDVRASAIEEVTLGLQGEDDFALRGLELRYAVNGGPEVVVPVAARGPASEGAHTLALEPHALAPGDLVSYYAVARDAKTEARTDMYFIEVAPFEREFFQSQQSGSGGAGGGAGDQSGQISRRQKELVVATWNLARERGAEAADQKDDARTLSAMQSRLQGQARTLAERMRRRELAGVNKDFQAFVEHMDRAAEAMGPAAQQLSAARWPEALTPEQQALQHLLRAEAVFRRIQVTSGSQGAGGGSGSETRDLAEMFDLELDSEKNQYETRQQASAGEREIDELQRRLKELARRHEEAAARPARRDAMAEAERRWEQQVLRREIEDLTRALQDAQQNAGRRGQEGAASREALDGAIRRLQEAARELENAERSREDRARNAEGARREDRVPNADGSRAADDARTADGTSRGVEARVRQRLREAQERLADEGRRADGRSGSDRPGAERALEGLTRARGRVERLRARGAEAVRDPDGRTARRTRDGASRTGAGGERDPQGRTGVDGERTRDGQPAAGERSSAGERPGERGSRGERGASREGGGAGERWAAGEPGADGGGFAGGGDAAPGDRVGGAWGDGPSTEERERLVRQALDDLAAAGRALATDGELGPSASQLVEEAARLTTTSARFRGNPELLERELEALMNAAAPLEERLRRRLEGAAGGDSVRTSTSPEMPPSHRDAIADYYRRLSEAK